MKTIKVLTLTIVLSMLLAPILFMSPHIKTAHAAYMPGAPIYFTVQPVATAPLVNLNASLYGLEANGTNTPYGDDPVGMNFTVAIHLENATVTNAPNGLEGVEVHFNFFDILNYCQPIAFQDMMGQPGGVLNNDGLGLIYAAPEPGFFNSTGGICSPSQYIGEDPSSPGYSGPVSYDLSVSSTGTPWNGADGIIAIITFKITGQPSTALGQTNFLAGLYIQADAVNPNAGAILTDPYDTDIAFDIIQGTVQIHACTGYHDVVPTDPPNKTVVGFGNNFNVTVTLTNVGNFTEIFCRAAIYLKSTSTLLFSGGSPIITLASGTSANITFTVSSGLPYGNRTLNVYAPSFGEPNHNNNATCG
jgi:hypothetical protein